MKRKLLKNIKENESLIPMLNKNLSQFDNVNIINEDVLNEKVAEINSQNKGRHGTRNMERLYG